MTTVGGVQSNTKNDSVSVSNEQDSISFSTHPKDRQTKHKNKITKNKYLLGNFKDSCLNDYD